MKEKNIEQKNQEMNERKVWVSVYCTVKLSRLHEHWILVFQTKICRLWTLLKKNHLCIYGDGYFWLNPWYLIYVCFHFMWFGWSFVLFLLFISLLCFPQNVCGLSKLIVLPPTQFCCDVMAVRDKRYIFRRACNSVSPFLFSLSASSF